MASASAISLAVGEPDRDGIQNWLRKSERNYSGIANNSRDWRKGMNIIKPKRKKKIDPLDEAKKKILRDKYTEDYSIGGEMRDSTGRAR